MPKRRLRAIRIASLGLILATLFMGGALAVTVWVTHQGVHHASKIVLRGQADYLGDKVRDRLRQPGPSPTRQELAQLVTRFRADGLRYVALLGPDGRCVLESGASSTGLTIAGLHTDVPVEHGAIARTVFRHPAHKPSWAPFLIEFDPYIANELRASAWRTLTIGLAAAGALLLVALSLIGWLLREQARTRQRELARRLTSLGEMSTVLAHEIRNPIASLKGNAQLLAEEMPPAGEKASGRVSLIVDEAIRLETLVDDLLEFARSGEIERRPVSPAELVGDVVARAATQRIRVDVANAPETWMLDPKRMSQVLKNLLDNALRAAATPVHASCRQHAGALEFVIRDQGPGVPPEVADKVFDPFVTSRTHGVGLGLAVARRLVELHGGKLTLEEGPEGGAVFTARLPAG